MYICVEKKNDELILIYESENYWIDDKKEIPLCRGTFNFKRSDIKYSDDYEYHFLLGKKQDNYYKIDKEKLNTSFDLYIKETLNVDYSWFYCEIEPKIYVNKKGEKQKTSKYGAILHCFKEFYKNDKLYFDTDDYVDLGENSTHITETTYLKFVSKFPTATNAKYYKLSTFTNILREEIEVKDYNALYQKYLSKNIDVNASLNIIPTESIKNELAKYEYIRDLISNMLSQSENDISIHEDRFTENIVKIFCLINPKYIKSVEKINITDFSEARGNCQCDIALIDYDGNIDLIEVKHPTNYPSIFRKNQYRNHYVPCGELSGSMNQLQHYLKSLTKMTDEDLNCKNEKIVAELHGLRLKAIHPKGFIIFGRDSCSFSDPNSEQKKKDFEIIKGMYTDLIDIITFDEFLRRIERIIERFKKACI